jgi:cation:H+ antiporter
MILIGTFACYFGAKYVVLSASDLAYTAKIPTQVVAATIVGFGTGFPEFVVSMMAVRRKKLDIAYGNLIGSNIVDPCVSVSLGILASEITVSKVELMGILGKLLPIAIIVDIFIIFAFNRKQSSKKFGTIVGIILIGFYCFFLIFSLVG